MGCAGIGATEKATNDHAKVRFPVPNAPCTKNQIYIAEKATDNAEVYISAPDAISMMKYVQPIQH